MTDRIKRLGRKMSRRVGKRIKADMGTTGCHFLCLEPERFVDAAVLEPGEEYDARDDWPYSYLMWKTAIENAPTQKVTPA